MSGNDHGIGWRILGNNAVCNDLCLGIRGNLHQVLLTIQYRELIPPIHSSL